MIRYGGQVLGNGATKRCDLETQPSRHVFDRRQILGLAFAGTCGCLSPSLAFASSAHPIFAHVKLIVLTGYMLDRPKSDRFTDAVLERFALDYVTGRLMDEASQIAVMLETPWTDLPEDIDERHILFAALAVNLERWNEGEGRPPKLLIAVGTSLRRQTWREQLRIRMFGTPLTLALSSNDTDSLLQATKSAIVKQLERSLIGPLLAYPVIYRHPEEDLKLDP